MTQNAINSQHPLIQLVTTSSTSVFTSSSAILRDDSIPQQTEGVEVITLSITPTSTTTKLVIEFTAPSLMAAVGNTCTTALFQDSTADALTASSDRWDLSNAGVSQIIYSMTSGTTSTTTFKVRFGPVAATNTVYINADASGTRLMGGVSYAWLTIKEYLY